MADVRRPARQSDRAVSSEETGVFCRQGRQEVGHSIDQERANGHKDSRPIEMVWSGDSAFPLGSRSLIFLVCETNWWPSNFLLLRRVFRHGLLKVLRSDRNTLQQRKPRRLRREKRNVRG